MKETKGGNMFEKHVDYHDLSAFEAVSMAVVAVLAVANGLLIASNLVA